MEPRITTSIVAFSHPFLIPGHEGELPAGRYEFLVEEELVQGLSFEAYRRTGSWLMVGGSGGSREMRAVSPSDLKAVLEHDHQLNPPPHS